MTANAMQGDREQCLKAGMNDYIAKPINPDVLYSTLLKWVKPARPQSASIEITKKRVWHEDMRDIPGLDGLETGDALMRLGGDRNLYHRILTRFHESQIDVVARLRQSLADSDRDTAQYIAHTLKGAAGNIGAVQIRDMAEELEHTIVKGGDIGEAFLAQLEVAVAEVLDSLGHWLPLNGEKIEQKNLSGRTEVLPLIGKMREMLEDYDSNVVDLMGELKEALNNSTVSKDLDRLQSMLDSYDFEAALEILKRLQDDIGAT
jgi:two-component system sensor histidine kinase/response regulator